MLTLDHGSLLTLQANVEKALSATEAKNRKAAVEELKNRARELGFDAAELFGKAGATGAAKTKTPSPARYASPVNPLDTWSGRGRKPSWVIAHLDAGKPLEDLAIKGA